MRRKVRKRDGNRCRWCGSTEKLHVHHLDADANNNRLSNLITLCEPCHRWAHEVLGASLANLIVTPRGRL